MLFTERGRSTNPQHEVQSKHKGERRSRCFCWVEATKTIISSQSALFILGQRFCQGRFEKPADAQGELTFPWVPASTDSGAVLMLPPCVSVCIKYRTTMIAPIRGEDLCHTAVPSLTACRAACQSHNILGW